MTEQRRLIELALMALETERAKIEQEITALQQQLRGQRSPLNPITARSAPNKGKTMSDAQKRKISEAMKKRWASRRKGVRTR